MISVYPCFFNTDIFSIGIGAYTQRLLKANFLTTEGCRVYTAMLQSAVIRCQADVYLALATHRMCPITLLEDRMTWMDIS